MSESVDAQAQIEALRAQIAPMLAAAAELDLEHSTSEEEIRAVERAMADAFPVDGDEVRALGETIARGVAEGWLCNRGEAESRFSRVAKPSDATHNLSVDCVSMIGEAVDHTHTKGELTIGFAAAGEDPESVRFEGRPAGWVFLPPGSRHRPHVEGGRMNLMYFLPEGAVQWHM